jgi:hypothetical protein
MITISKQNIRCGDKEEIKVDIINYCFNIEILNWVHRISFFIILLIPTLVFSEENIISNEFDKLSDILVDYISDREKNFLVSEAKEFTLCEQDSLKTDNIKLQQLEKSKKIIVDQYKDIQKRDFEFVKFNLLRGLSKRVTLIWYFESNIDKYSLNPNQEYTSNENEQYTYEIRDKNEMVNWHIAISSPIIRNFYSSVSGGSFGGSKNSPIPHHGILFETDKEKIFIGITRFGFHFGRWEGNKIDQSKLFYSPNLSLFLDDCIKKNKLQNFPKIYIDILSGKDIIQSQIEGYQYRKQEENNMENEDSECVCPENLN